MCLAIFNTYRILRRALGRHTVHALAIRGGLKGAKRVFAPTVNVSNSNHGHSLSETKLDFKEHDPQQCVPLEIVAKSEVLLDVPLETKLLRANLEVYNKGATNRSSGIIKQLGAPCTGTLTLHASTGKVPDEGDKDTTGPLTRLVSTLRCLAYIRIPYLRTTNKKSPNFHCPSTFT